MPNRMIKETIRTSKSVNNLSDFQFRLWLYLITYVDDYGRGSADPEILKGLCFPRRKGVTERQISDALTVLASTGMIFLYDDDGDSYLCFPKWGEHQRIQTKKSKFPSPPSEFFISPLSTVDYRESPPETKDKDKPKTNQTKAKDARARASGSAACEPRRESEEGMNKAREQIRQFAEAAGQSLYEYLTEHPGFLRYFDDAEVEETRGNGA